MGPSIHNSRKELGGYHQHAQIAAAYEDCRQTFDQLSSLMEANRQVWEGNADFLDSFKNSLVHWANVHHAENGSLDHALRKSSDLRDQVVDLLENLNQKLQNVLEDLQITATPLLSPALLEDNWTSYFDRQTDLKTVSKLPVSEEMLKERLGPISSVLETLRGLNATLKNPFPSDMFSSDVLLGDDKADIQLAARLFPKAPEQLKQRLGHANWLRKCYLRSLRADKYAGSRKRAGATLPPSGRTQDGHVETLDSPRAKEGRLPPTFMLNDQRAALHRLASTTPSDTASNSGTVFSKADSGYNTNVATSVTEFDEGLRSVAIPIPSPPVPLNAGRSFLCPYCALPITVGGSNTEVDRGHAAEAPASRQRFTQGHSSYPEHQTREEPTVMDVSTSAEWVAHFFADLEPYVCTSHQCLQGPKTYATQDAWMHHELYTHHIQYVWSCEICSEEWLDERAFCEHLTATHHIPEEHIPTISQLSVKPSNMTPTQMQCPLCLFDCSFESYYKHLGDHLQQLALTSVETENVETSRTVSVSTYEGDKFTLLQDFIQEQSRKSGLQQNQSIDSLATRLQGLWTEKSNPEPGDGSPSKVLASRPRLSSRGVSYTYMQRVRELKVEEATKSAATTPLAQWKSVEPTVSAHSGQATICTLQPPWNPDFVGRIVDLGTIDDRVKEEGHIAVIRGPGGIGKSAIATAYTWKFKSCYSHIFWVPAETAMVCADSFCQIALKVIANAEEVAEEERLVNMGREFLERTTRRWLLVFDNVDEGFDLRRFLPSDMSKTHGSVLITTRKTDLDVSRLSNKTSAIDLNALTLEESRELLLKSANRGEPLEDMRSHPEYKLAGDIAKRAEKLPLALSLIAGFVLASECTLAYFVELWNERQMSRNARDASSDANGAMEMVWNIGLREVETEARQLLNILAFFDSDKIQKDLLVGPHEDPLLEMLHSHSPMRWNRMTSKLSKRRLITIRNRDGEEFLTIHRKLQAKILEELNQPDNVAERTKVFERVFLLIRGRFPRPSPIQVPEPEKWPICRQYLPHILSIKRLWQSGIVEIPPSVKLARLISDAGIDLWERCLTVEGLELLRSAEAILDQGGFREDLLRANIHVVVSLLLQDSGIAHLAECRDRIARVLDIRVKHQENCDPADYTKNDDILLHNAWSDYACVLLQYNQYKEAARIFDMCFEKYQRWGPPEEIPYEYAKYYHHKAYCLMYEGNFEQAVPLAEFGLHWVQIATGQSAATNRWRFDLACLVLQSGDKQRALDLHKEVLEARLKLHGKFGLLTFQSYYAVGAAHRWLNELSEAEVYMRKILDIDQTRPGICTEAALAQTQFNLSQILAARAKDSDKTDDRSPVTEGDVSARLQESAVLAQMARKVLLKPHPLGPLETDTVQGQKGLLTQGPNGIPEDHELALFDHLQPVFDGRFTGLHLLRYLQYPG